MRESIHIYTRLSTDGCDDWYSQNKHKWGNWRWLCKIALFVWIILSISIIMTLVLDSDLMEEYRIEEILYAFMIVLLAISSFSIWYKIPYFDDEFYIFKEMKLLIICSFILCIAWFILIFWVKRGNAAHIAQIGIVSLFNFKQVFIPEFIVLNRIKYSRGAKNKKNAHSENCNEKRIKEKGLFRILLSSDIGMEEYVKHLQKEYAYISKIYNYYTYISDSAWRIFCFSSRYSNGSLVLQTRNGTNTTSGH